MYNRFTEKRRRYPCSTGTVSTLGCFLSRLSRGFSAQFDIYFRSGIRVWDYPKIAACPDSGCACYSLKSQFSPSQRRSFSSPKSVLYCKKISGKRTFLWNSNGYFPGFTRDTTESPSSLSGCSRTSTPASPSWSARMPALPKKTTSITTSSGTPPSASRSKSMVCCGINTSAKLGARLTKAPSAKCMRTAFRSPRASPSLMLMTSTRSAPSVAAEPTMNTPRTSAKTTGWICGDTNSSGSGSSTSAYPTARHIRPCARISRLPSSRSKRCSTTTPISSGNAFPRGCPSVKQRMPCSRIAA